MSDRPIGPHVRVLDNRGVVRTDLKLTDMVEFTFPDGSVARVQFSQLRALEIRGVEPIGALRIEPHGSNMIEVRVIA